MNIQEENSARYFRVQSEREQTFNRIEINNQIKNISKNYKKTNLLIAIKKQNRKKPAAAQSKQHKIRNLNNSTR